MKILVLASKSRSLINFRGHLLKEIKNLGHDVFAVAPDHDNNVKEVLEGWNISYKTVSMDRTGLSVLKDLGTLISLHKMFREIAPDLVLSYTIKPVIYGSIVASWTKVPNIYSMITGLGTFFSKHGKNSLIYWFIKQMYRAAGRRNNGMVFQNPDDLQTFVSRGIVSMEKTHLVNGSGVDLDHFRKEPIPTNPVRFLFIGRFLKEKGINDFISACRIIKQKYPNVEAGILGSVDSNPRSVSEVEVQKWVGEGIVKWYGFAPDVRPYIRDCSVFVLPSHLGEGTPRTALESMAMGRPIITTDSPGCRETVINGENGFLVPVKNSNALADAMERFIKRPEMIEMMGNRSREIAEKKFDVHAVNDSLLRFMRLKN